MSLPVFYIAEPVTQPVITLNEETSRHVIQVLRMKKGEEINLSDGKGSVYHTSILDDNKKRCTVNLIKSAFHENNKVKISVAISLLKNTSRFEWFLEKATEIGVNEFIPMLCSRTEKQHFRHDRMRAILISSMLQSQQLWLPALHEPVAVDQVISNSTYQTKWIAHCEDGKKNLLTPGGNAQILIGPEGDFTTEEIQLAIRHNYQPVTLGDTRLRTETAGIVAATLLCQS